MKVYIIASHNNMSLAVKLLEDIRNVNIISNPSEKYRIGIGKRILSADVILTIIDEEYVGNSFLELELQIALCSAKENLKQIIIPVVLNNVEPPENIKDINYIHCDAKSENDLEIARILIKRMLYYRKRYVVENNIKKASTRTSSIVILSVAIEFFAMFFIVILLLDNSSISKFNNTAFGDNPLSLLLTLISFMLTFTVLLTSYFSLMKTRQHKNDEEAMESYSRRLKNAIVSDEIINAKRISIENEESKKEIDALGRMMINLEDIKEFYTWSQKQAKASFILAVSMCVVGFALMITAIVLPIIINLSFQMSLIPAVGGVITELIAGTALVVYRNSLAQLNHYHKALHEDERFLSSVNLLGKFSGDQEKDDMLREIIRSEIQMNLFGLDDNIKENNSKNKKNSMLINK